MEKSSPIQSSISARSSLWLKLYDFYIKWNIQTSDSIMLKLRLLYNWKCHSWCWLNQADRKQFRWCIDDKKNNLSTDGSQAGNRKTGNNSTLEYQSGSRKLTQGHVSTNLAESKALIIDINTQKLTWMWEELRWQGLVGGNVGDIVVMTGNALADPSTPVWNIWDLWKLWDLYYI